MTADYVCVQLKYRIMKASILLFGITLTSILAISKADRNISGTWVMERGDSKTSPPVIRINMGEGIWEGRIDMPEQQVFDRKLQSVMVDGDSVFITIYKDGPVICAKMTDNKTISGCVQGETCKDAVLLKKY